MTNAERANRRVEIQSWLEWIRTAYAVLENSSRGVATGLLLGEWIAGRVESKKKTDKPTTIPSCPKNNK